MGVISEIHYEQGRKDGLAEGEERGYERAREEFEKLSESVEYDLRSEIKRLEEQVSSLRDENNTLKSHCVIRENALYKIRGLTDDDKISKIAGVALCCGNYTR